MGRTAFYPKEKEQTIIMDLVCNESAKRGLSYDDYNTQEIAYRQAISDGAMRTDNYFNKMTR